MCFRIKRKVLPGFSKFESLDKLIFIQNQIGFSRAPPGCDVLNVLGGENDLLGVAALFLHVGVHKPFHVELAENELLSGFVVANHPHVVVDLAALVLFLRWIRGLVVLLQKTIVEDKRVRSLGGAMTRLTVLVPAPRTDKES